MEEEVITRRRKRDRHPEEYTRNKIKKARISGAEYTNYAGQHVPDKQIGADCK